MEQTKVYSLHIGPAVRSASHGRPFRQRAVLQLDAEMVAKRDFIRDRYASLCGLVALRREDAKQVEPLPDDFPMVVAPVVSVHPYKSTKVQSESETPAQQTERALANGIEILFDPACLGKPPQRDVAVREFCAAIADFLIQPEGSPYSVPTPRNAAPAAAAATSLSAVAAVNAGAA